MKTSKTRSLLLASRRYFSVMLFAYSLFTGVASCQTYNAIDWGTYFNDNDHFPNFNYDLDDDVNDMAVSTTSPESIYIVGQTEATGSGSLSVCSGNHTLDLHDPNGFLAKYNRCGELIWSTYIGSAAWCVALDNENGKTIIYVGGNANPGTAFSCDGSSSPVFQSSATHSSNCFLAKYVDNDTAVSLLRWTYLQGTETDTATGTDAVHTITIYKHRVFFCGDTFSGDIYLGAQHTGDTAYAGIGDAYMAEMDSMLSTLKYFTFIGGPQWDRAHDLKVYKAGNKPLNVFVGGSTLSEEGIAMGTGYDLTYNGNNDTYLCKWEGSEVTGIFSQKWGAYVGGSGMEHGRRVAVDGKGNIFFTGWTGSNNFPVTPLAYDTLFSGSGNSGLDAFVMKVSNSGQKLWATYLGGNSKEEVGRSLLLFKKNTIQYVAIAGVTKSNSTSFPLVNPIQNKLNGDDTQVYYDDFIAIFTDPPANTQQQLVFSSFIGGTKEEHVGVGLYHPVIALGPNKEIYFTTASKSSDIQTVIGSNFQDIVHDYNGASDVITTKLFNKSNNHQYNCTSLAFADKNSSMIGDPNTLHIFPNPFQEGFTAEISSLTDSHSSIEVIDLYGKSIWKEEFAIQSGVNQIPIDLPNTPPGLYVLRISDNDRVIFTSLIKQ